MVPWLQAAQGHTPTLLLDPPLSSSFALKLQTPKRRVWGMLNVWLAHSGCNSAPRLNFGNVFKYSVWGPLISILKQAMGPLKSLLYCFKWGCKSLTEERCDSFKHGSISCTEGTPLTTEVYGGWSGITDEQSKGNLSMWIHNGSTINKISTLACGYRSILWCESCV